MGPTTYILGAILSSFTILASFFTILASAALGFIFLPSLATILVSFLAILSSVWAEALKKEAVRAKAATSLRVVFMVCEKRDCVN